MKERAWIIHFLRLFILYWGGWFLQGEGVKARTRRSPRWSAFSDLRISPPGSWRRETESSFALSQRNARDRWWRSRGVVAKYWSPRAWRDFPLIPLCSPPTDRPTDVIRRLNPSPPPTAPPARPSTPPSPTKSFLSLSLSLPRICVFFIFTVVDGIRCQNDEANVTAWMITHVRTLTHSTIFIYLKGNLVLPTSYLCSTVKTSGIFRIL